VGPTTAGARVAEKGRKALEVECEAAAAGLPLIDSRVAVGRGHRREQGSRTPTAGQRVPQGLKPFGGGAEMSRPFADQGELKPRPTKMKTARLASVVSVNRRRPLQRHFVSFLACLREVG
jgi:hypothetical protein